MTFVAVVESPDNPLYGRLQLEAENLSQNVSFFEPKQLSDMHLRTWIVAYDSECIRGLVALRKESGRIQNAVGVGYISTHKKFQNQGVASVMVRALFEYAKQIKKDIANTPYEPDGECYLRHVMEREARRYVDVTLHERDYHYC